MPHLEILLEILASSISHEPPRIESCSGWDLRLPTPNDIRARSLLTNATETPYSICLEDKELICGNAELSKRFMSSQSYSVKDAPEIC